MNTADTKGQGERRLRLTHVGEAVVAFDGKNNVLLPGALSDHLPFTLLSIGEMTRVGYIFSLSDQGGLMYLNGVLVAAAELRNGIYVQLSSPSDPFVLFALNPTDDFDNGDAAPLTITFADGRGVDADDDSDPDSEDVVPVLCLDEEEDGRGCDASSDSDSLSSPEGALGVEVGVDE